MASRTYRLSFIAQFVYSLITLSLLISSLSPYPTASALSLGRVFRDNQREQNGLPSIVLVPGAWHSPIHYSAVTGILQSQKYEVISQQLPSVGATDATQQSVHNDATFIKNNMINPLLDQGKDVLLVMHSYGGCPGAEAAKGLSKFERTAAGQKGGIIGLVFICAFIANEGDSLRSKLPGGVYDTWVIEDTTTHQLTVSNPQDVFYNDLDDATANWAVSQLLPEAEPALSSPSGPPAWLDSVYNDKRAYIHTEQDHCIPPAAQDAMVTSSGVSWDVKSLNSSHSPFLSHPQDVASYIVDWATAYDY